MSQWTRFTRKNASINRGKTLLTLRALSLNAATFRDWHDANDGLAPSYRKEGTLFRCDLLGIWLRNQGLDPNNFIETYKPRRMNRRKQGQQTVRRTNDLAKQIRTIVESIENDDQMVAIVRRLVS